jgi:beta-N-acetylhexosaminidase
MLVKLLHNFKIKRAVKKKPGFGLTTWFFILAAFVMFSYPLLPGFTMAQAQEITAHDRAIALLDNLTPQERVGQLFLVTFKGTDVGPDSQIYDLISNHHIGGVVLQAKNDNFVAGDQTLTEALTLTRQIQLDRWTAAQKTRIDPVTNEEYQPNFIPLFIALPQEGDGYPYDQVLSSMTPLPNEMAIGATWNPDLARQVGSVLGQELSAIGVNMLFGPSLDVLEAPHIEGSNDLGTRAFGGDPFWVSEMGSAFIQGVHQGSASSVAIVASHFPGFGASDRLPEEEVATVRKQLEQLKSFDLIPFFDVTGDATSPEATTDALLVSHIRYQGFQGNIRLTTRPLSFDPQAFNQLMELPELNTWRNNGGVMVSDDLGSRAVRGYYDLTSQTFDMPRRVALSAFQAGNDLLYVADFSSGDLDSYTSAVQTLDFFTQKYREDTFFAQRVDQAVARILELKFRLYGDFGLNRVLASQDKLAQVGQSGQVTVEVARQAATLISPSLAELDDTVPDPPNRNDRIVFFTDTRTGTQCSSCQPEPLLDVQALEGVVLRRYGPQAGGQVVPNNLSSYSLADLQQVLTSGTGDSDLERDLGRSNWIVFAMLNSSPDLPSFNTLKQFLSERPDLFQKKRLIVFAFNAPYYLDATNISKLTAYYGLYSKAPQFVDVAAYLLFQELRPNGALPISVMGVYDLNTMLTPDPDQVINLRLDVPGEEITNSTTTPEPQVTEYKVGDVITIRTDEILDHNGNQVPDGTPVEFIIGAGGDTAAPRQVETTEGGIARTTIQATNSGALDVRAVSEPAKQSNTLHFDIQSDNLGSIPPTATQEPSPTPTETQTPTLTPTTQPVEPIQPPSRPQLADWIMAVLVSAAISWSAYRLSALIGQVRWGVRSGFLTLIGGLLAYSYLALQMPGSEELLKNSVSRGVFLSTLLGAGLGLLITWLWRALSATNEENTSNHSSVHQG